MHTFEVNIDQYLSWDRLNEADLPNTLYHYTSFEGLFGILEKQPQKAMCATELKYMNDSSERLYAIEVAKKVINDANESDKAGKYKDILNALILDLEFFKEVPVFAICFSEENDLLSQWRGYCPNGGCNLGFERTVLMERAAKQGFRLYPCIYDRTEQETVFKKIIDDLMATYKSLENTAENINLGKSFAKAIISIAPVIKHEGFKEEKEWRIFSPPIGIKNDAVQFRTKNRLKVPYLNFYLNDEKEPFQLASIFASPMTPQDLVYQGVTDFLQNQNISFCSLGFSSIPYRPL